ncbi:hypothetical protein Tco_1210288 [Tanacetum coccineum]
MKLLLWIKSLRWLKEAQLADAKASSARLTDELARTEAKLSDKALYLVRRLLSSNEFHAALAHIASLGISYGVEMGLRMGRTDTKFEVAIRNVSNFFIVSEGALSKVTMIFPDKLVCSATSAFSALPVVNEALDQAPIDHATDGSPPVV